ncbi:MAG: hypothetical protein ACI9LN_004752 [Saprospiraceae bacterium]|jgi:hypothetical protein
MKNILLILTFLICLTCQVFAESQTSPEPILPITRVDKPFSYYQQQATLWQGELKNDGKNATAWWNYFKAARYANMKSTNDATQFNLAEIAQKINKTIPDSFENHYIQYIQIGRNQKSFDHLLKAYEIGPKRPEIQESMANYYEINLNKEKLREVMQRIFDTKDYSPGALKWNYNMLMSVEQDGILLTWVDNDTYPSWILQLVQNVRPDITIINTSLMMGFEDYRKAIFERADIPAFDLKIEEVNYNYTDYSVKITEHICKKSQRPVYFAPTIPQVIRDKFQGDLFMTGLAFKYSDDSFDNIAVIKNNYENKFLKDYLTVNFEKETSEQVVNVMNVNYLPALLRLHKHYEAAGEMTKATDLKKVVKIIAEKGGREDDISAYLGERQSEENINSILKGRDLDQNFVKIKGNLYAMDTEMTNERYEGFLMDLLKNKDYKKLENAKMQKVNWRAMLPDSFKNIPDKELFGHGHPDDPEMPVYNISYEGAQLYCQWITQVYNQSTDRKKRFKKVLFRLPTEVEWNYAAHGAHTAPYPWGGQYVTNAKGCFLFNGDALNLKDSDGVFIGGVEPCKDCPVKLGDFKDGGFFQVIADAYFPNDYGLYNMSGNLSEMIDVKGEAMGGSWANPPEECKVTSKKSFEETDPSVGFRAFMEVIEYKK